MTVDDATTTATEGEQQPMEVVEEPSALQATPASPAVSTTSVRLPVSTPVKAAPVTAKATDINTTANRKT